MKKTISIIIVAVLLMTASCNRATHTSANPKGDASDSSVAVTSDSPSGENSKDLPSDNKTSSTPSPSNQNGDYSDEMRGIWISYGELSTAFSGNFHSEISKMFDNIQKLGLNTVFVHARPFCDAFYPSELFPWSAYISGTQGVAPNFDPFQYMVDEAHKRELEFHAWINPYRISYKTEDPNTLADSSYVKKYMIAFPDSRFAVAESGGLYLNPANSDANRLIVDGVKEILDKYDVDGIHFDDYFYPTTKQSFDSADYAEYTASASSPLSLADWRRENVNDMLRSVYKTVKSYGKDIAFGVSPAGNYKTNYSDLYADAGAWAKGGYVDYLIPQMYFGFNHSIDFVKYDDLARYWSQYSDKVTMYAGLGAYKIGAGSDGEKADWASGNLLQRQIICAREYDYEGFVIFSYTSLFSDAELNRSEKNKIAKLIGE